jgi:hypothetical protein
MDLAALVALWDPQSARLALRIGQAPAIRENRAEAWHFLKQANQGHKDAEIANEPQDYGLSRRND